MENASMMLIRIVFFIPVTCLILWIVYTFIIKKKGKINKENRYESFKNFINKENIGNYKSVCYKETNNDIVPLIEMNIDKENKQLAIYSYYDNISSILKFNEILDFEVDENGNSVISSRTGSAVAGGLLFGGLGAVAGASGSRTIKDMCNSLKLKIYINDIEDSIIAIEFIPKGIENVPVNSPRYKNIANSIDKMIGFLKIISEENKEVKRKDSKNVKIENVEELRDISQNGIDDIQKLAELKEKGIITPEEFEESKKKILSKL